MAFPGTVRPFRSARIKANISQEDLAEIADIDRTYPSLLERGLREPGLGVVIRFGNALDVGPLLLLRMTIARLT
jgi:transcriptional regulator with XRE-family HTH domain